MDKELYDELRQLDAKYVTTNTLSSEIRSTTTLTDSTGNPFTNPIYVEWYWVVLGLVIPIILGSVFCVLDHLRRRKGQNPRQTEQRLESMCERNKYVPPKYEEIIPNNRIVIDSVPGVQVQSRPNSVPAVHLPSPLSASVADNHTPEMVSSQPVFTVEAEASARRVSHSHTLPVPLISSNNSFSRLSLDNFSVNSATNLNVDYSKDHSSSHQSTEPSEPTEHTTTLQPPSYEEYHKYELYGSRAELV